MKTTAAVLKTLLQPLEIWDLEIPPLSKGQILVEIAYSGVCRTQLNEIKGYKGPDPYLPHTLGHEGSGIIREIGEGVTKVKVDDHVVLSWLKGIGLETGGTKYASKYGMVNSGPISTFMTLAVVSENRLVAIPKQFPLREAALLGCAMPTGAGVVFNQLGLKKENSFAIFGLGGIGLSAILAAKFIGSYPIIAVDVSDEKLGLAKTLGATHCINANVVNPNQTIHELTQGKGVDGVLECVGQKEAMEKAFIATSAKGTCAIAGNLPKGQTIQIDPFDLIGGKKIIGSWGGASQIDRDIPRYLAMAEQSSLDRLITHEQELAQINFLFELLEKGKMGRGIISLGNRKHEG